MCVLSPMETICIRCQILFSGKNKKNIKFSSVEFVHREVNVKDKGAYGINRRPDASATELLLALGRT